MTTRSPTKSLSRGSSVLSESDTPKTGSLTPTLSRASSILSESDQSIEHGIARLGLNGPITRSKKVSTEAANNTPNTSANVPSNDVEAVFKRHKPVTRQQQKRKSLEIPSPTENKRYIPSLEWTNGGTGRSTQNSKKTPIVSDFFHAEINELFISKKREGVYGVCGFGG